MSKIKNFFNKLFGLNCYALTTKDNNKNFLTITQSRYEALEYANRLLQIEVFEHYSLWCKSRNYDPADMSIWYIYFNDCLNEEQKQRYKIIKIKVFKKDLIAIMRMFGNCVPLGCSFDTPAEYEYTKNKKEQQEKKNELIKKAIDDLVDKFTASINQNNIKDEKKDNGNI